MVSVQQVSDQYTNKILIHPPGLADGVCGVCHTWVTGYSLCWACKENRGKFGQLAADVVVPIGMSVKGQQYAHELHNYKDGRDSRTALLIGARLACVLWRFLTEHEACVARAAGVEAAAFQAVTTVPSGSGRIGEHPLRRMAATWVEPARSRYVDLLEATNANSKERDHEVVVDRYRMREKSVKGASVLLIDDTWTKGVHAQAAAATLKAAGATHVAVLVLGRHINPEYQDHKLLVGRAAQRPFTWDWCCVHDLPNGLW
ncbi:hypothetical protein [Catenulispora rubra]|uniref:hypothetical protein n=1 Tax=Catenulispora rubra TaxID=280293 RepID=UPI001E3CF3B0|nr:hypothetical protein [Catenulispora rubra]